jgi:hypothetical protein
LKNVFFVVHRKKIGFSLASVECVLQFTKTLYEKKHVNGLCSRLFNIFIYFFFPILCISKRSRNAFRRNKRRIFREIFGIFSKCVLRKVRESRIKFSRVIAMSRILAWEVVKRLLIKLHWVSRNSLKWFFCYYLFSLSCNFLVKNKKKTLEEEIFVRYK